jgi:hypothetical protein
VISVIIFDFLKYFHHLLMDNLSRRVQNHTWFLFLFQLFVIFRRDCLFGF